MTTTQRVALLAGQSCVSLAGVFIALIIFTPDADVAYLLGWVISTALGTMLVTASRPDRRKR